MPPIGGISPHVVGQNIIALNMKKAKRLGLKNCKNETVWLN